MDFIPDEILKYAEGHSEQESPLLKEINRFTNTNVLRPRMLSGHLQGRFLSMISHLMQPDYVVEIGTYTGYSAICLSEGLSKDGKLITIEFNEELEDITRGFLDRSERVNQIEFVLGDALEVLPNLEKGVDLIFMDADKPNYLKYYDLCLPLLRSGGVILADNVLWSGKILEKTHKTQDKSTPSLQRFNDFVAEDERVSCTLLPVRDGILMIRKK